jgi:DNA-binding transcriptional LysR family regulator
MNELDAMVADVTALRQEVVGTVRLGMIGTTGRWLVPQLFDLLRLRHPHIHLNIAEGSSLQLERQLASGQLDLAVVTFPLSGDEVMAADLFNEDIVLIVPRGHPLGEATSLPLSRLADIELLLPAPGTALRAEIDSAVGPARVVLRPAMELDGVRLIASLAFDGYGPAILPATAIPGPGWGRSEEARPPRGAGAGGDRRARAGGPRSPLHARGHLPELIRRRAAARATWSRSSDPRRGEALP